MKVRNLPEVKLLEKFQLEKDGASAGIIVTDDQRYLLQLRDTKKEIWYPNHWGCFGGKIDAGENSLRALEREIQEELNFKIENSCYFTQLVFDLTELGSCLKYRFYYEIKVKNEVIKTMSLNEGQEMRLFPINEIRTLPNITPYDRMALELYANRQDVVPDLEKS